MAPAKTSRYDDIVGIGEGPRNLAARPEEIFGEVMQEKHRQWHEH